MEVGQPGYAWAPIWKAGTADRGLACCIMAPVLRTGLCVRQLSWMCPCLFLLLCSTLHIPLVFLSVWWVVKSQRKDCICRSSFVWIYQNHRRKGFFAWTGFTVQWLWEQWFVQVVPLLHLPFVVFYEDICIEKTRQGILSLVRF